MRLECQHFTYKMIMHTETTAAGWLPVGITDQTERLPLPLTWRPEHPEFWREGAIYLRGGRRIRVIYNDGALVMARPA